MKTPCIINNFNQLEYLIPLVNKLQDFKQLQIYILDNNSKYTPLLTWYETLAKHSISVIRLKHNLGHRAPWKSLITYELAWKHKSPFYIVTDPDLDISTIPSDTLDYMAEILTQKKETFKVGLSLETEDIPNYYPAKAQVQSWESQNWALDKKESFKEKTLYRTGIDTTFAMYNILHTEITQSRFLKNPCIKFNCNFIDSSYRLDRPYTARHLPWYLDYNHLSENQKFYINLCNKEKKNPSSWNLIASEKSNLS